MAAPTPEELIVLKKFRENVTDLELTDAQLRDSSLLTWLRARDLDIPKAKDMLAKSIAWKKSSDFHNVLSWTPPESYTKLFPLEIVGNSKDGCPVAVISYGRWDVRSTIEAGEKETWLRYVDHGLARILAAMDEANKTRDPKLTPVTQAVVIIDIEGIDALRQISSAKSIGVQLEVVRRLDSNFPEVLGTAYLIRAPRIFTFFFDIVKPCLSAHTFSKIHMYSSDESKWKPALLKLIPKDQLPPLFGGTNPKVYNSIAQVATNQNGGEPKSFCNGDFTNTCVAPGKLFKVNIEILEKYTILCWAFKIENQDIGFSIMFNDEEEILPSKKYTAARKGQIDTHEGCWTCKMIGTYTLIFDNTYSRFRSKNLDYNVYTKH